MTSNSDVATAFICGRKATAKNMYTDGKTVYSYGNHFPIAAKIRGIILFNTDKYSSSTSAHQCYVRMELMGSTFSKEHLECNTNEIKHAIDYPDDPIIITKEVNPESIDQALELLRIICKQKGMKCFRMKKLKNFLCSEMV